MFCSNCGSKVPDGSKFCSTCGARLVSPEGPADLNDAVKAFSAGKEEQPTVAKKPAVSFDWSEVKEESHKRAIPEVHSPWGATGLDESEVTADLNTAAQERSRTMSFIEILKKEREEKALAAEEEARRVTEREETPVDYSAFEKAPSYYVPPMYEDVAVPAEEPFEEPKFDESENDTPKHGAYAYEEPVYEMPTFEPINMETDEPKEDFAPEVPEYKPFEAAYVAPAVEEIKTEEPQYVAPAFEEEEKEEPMNSLDAELAAILQAGAGKPVGEDQKVDLFKEAESVDDLAEEYLAMDEFADEEPADSVEEPEDAIPVFEEPVFEEPAYEEPSIEDYVVEEIVSEEPSTEEPVFEEPVVEEVADDTESEIEALKRRLAELMGEPVEEPEVQETSDDVEDLEDVAAELGDIAEEVTLVDPMPEEEPALEVSESEPVEIEEPAEDEAEELGTDAMSVEDLEKDLFGETSDEDVETEATKKIDKFYTLYKKNEEFQKLLDEEYNKLQSESEPTPVAVEEVVPTVSDVLAENKPAEEKLSFEAPKEESVPAAVDKVKEAVSVPEIVKDEQVSEDKKIPEVIEEELEEEESAGGTVLTVIAVVIAVLLVILLGIILVLNFLPDSGIALKIDSVIETITSYFSVVDVKDTFLL